MKEKKTGTKFTILFNRDDPVHIQAADILTRQPQRGKAHYIAQTIVHFEKIKEASDTLYSTQVDKNYIEDVVNRVLRDRQMNGASAPSISVPAGQGETPSAQSLPNMECKSYDEVMDSFDEVGLKNIEDALDMFRRK
ncbi:MAG: hypothetical protein FWE81_08580 [Rikenellaceae bacterium]|nr:hypothetical protein [Rikenellaceae bacterium]